MNKYKYMARYSSSGVPGYPDHYFKSLKAASNWLSPHMCTDGSIPMYDVYMWDGASWKPVIDTSIFLKAT